MRIAVSQMQGQEFAQPLVPYWSQNPTIHYCIKHEPNIFFHPHLCTVCKNRGTLPCGGNHEYLISFIYETLSTIDNAGVYFRAAKTQYTFSNIQLCAMAYRVMACYRPQLSSCAVSLSAIVEQSQHVCAASYTPTLTHNTSVSLAFEQHFYSSFIFTPFSG